MRKKKRKSTQSFTLVTVLAIISALFLVLLVVAPATLLAVRQAIIDVVTLKDSVEIVFLVILLLVKRFLGAKSA